jgi:uncharacterized protein YaaQ
MSTGETLNRLVIATVGSSQVGGLIERLTRAGFQVTEVDSGGGLLQEATVTLFIGLDQEGLPALLDHLRQCCQTRRQLIPAHVEIPPLDVQPMMIEALVGGATIYVLDVERFEQL